MHRFLSLLLPLAFMSALLIWITSGITIFKSDDYTNIWYQHHYEYLTEGFAQGHTHLSLTPSKELLTLRDPYDHNQNYPYRLWDATLYHNKYYLYYGPTPAILFMLPLKILTQWTMPQWLSEAIFAVIGCLGLSLLVWDIACKYFPKVSILGVCFTIFTILNVTWLPVTLRWASVWGLPVVAACTCLWWTLYFLWKFQLCNGEELDWAILSGFSLGLLLGSRATYLFAATILLFFYFIPKSPHRGIKLVVLLLSVVLYLQQE